MTLWERETLNLALETLKDKLALNGLFQISTSINLTK